jgi:hypothetical protein
MKKLLLTAAFAAFFASATTAQTAQPAKQSSPKKDQTAPKTTTPPSASQVNDDGTLKEGKANDATMNKTDRQKAILVPSEAPATAPKAQEKSAREDKTAPKKATPAGSEKQ